MPRNEVFRAWLADRVPAYIDGRVSDLAILGRALAAGDLSSIQTIAHNLKGTGIAYGFPKITEIGGRLESAAKKGDRAEVVASLSALRSFLDGLEKAPLGIDAAAECFPKVVRTRN